MPDKTTATADIFADYLIVGYWAQSGGGSRRWGTTAAAPNVIWTATGSWNSRELSALSAALRSWSDVCAIRFTPSAANGDDATIEFLLSSDTPYYAGSWSSVDRGQTVYSQMIFNANSYNRSGLVTDGAYENMGLIHELGHSIGLGHPGPYNGASSYANNAIFSNDTRQYSLMSYWNAGSDGSGSHGNHYPQTPMLLDIYAAQRIYGANWTTRNGDTVYGFHATADAIGFNFTDSSPHVLCIWDGGGIDTIDLSGYTVPAVLNLSAGSFSSAAGISNNITIAYQCDIENGIGGTAADTISGNLLDNLLTGGPGDDRMDGGSGNDTVCLSGRLDQYVATLNDDGEYLITDQMVGRDGSDRLTGVEWLRFADRTVAINALITLPVPGVTLVHDSGSLDTDRITNDSALAITGVTSGAYVEYAINGSSWTSHYDPVEGANVVQIRQTHRVSGGSSDAAVLIFTLDTTAPPTAALALQQDSGSSNSDAITSLANLSMTGIETGALVSYNVNDNGWQTSYQPVEGRNSIQIYQTDRAGNRSYVSDPFDFTLDTLSPAAPGATLSHDSGRSATDALTYTAALSLTGIEDAAMVEYRINNGRGWSTTYRAVEGYNSVQLRQTDRAGHVSPLSAAVVFTLDTFPPSTPQLLLVNDSGGSSGDAITSSAGLSLAGIESGATVSYNVNNGGWQTSYDPVEGHNSLQVRQTDAAGHSSPAALLEWSYDTVAPLAPSQPELDTADDSGLSDHDHLTNHNSDLTLAGYCQEQGGVVILFDHETALTTSVITGTRWGSTLSLAEGSHVLTARQTDRAGHDSPRSEPLLITVDRSAPVAPMVVLAYDSGISATDRITHQALLSVTAVESDAVVGYSHDGGQTWQENWSAIEGLQQLQIRQTDAAGNHSAVTQLEWSYDTTAPSVPTDLDLDGLDDTGISSSDHLTSLTSGLTIRGNHGEVGSTLLLFDDGNQNGVLENHEGLATLTITDASWNGDIGLTTGSHAIRAMQVDRAGNPALSALLWITVDPAVAPSAPVSLDLSSLDDTGLSPNDNLTRTTSDLTIRGIGQNKATVALFDDRNNNGLSDAGELLSTLAVTAARGNWSKSISLAPGVHTLRAVQYRGLAVGTASDALTITIDTSAPAAPSAQVTGTVVGGRGEVGALVTLFVDRNSNRRQDAGEKSLATVPVDPNGQWHWSPMAMAAANYSIRAFQTDAAGNVGTTSNAVTLVAAKS
ncbi:MAG: M10 family metallopeptidase C-terminal domain-containing protein [Magnetococcales bacterium]|nr:M10 family metallopeptidase C-terminal domain-containing protein [Magnetococcales bacterium]